VVVPRLDNARSTVSHLQDILKIRIGFAHQPQDIETRHVQLWVVTSKCLLDLAGQEQGKKLLPDLKLIICEDMELLDDTYELGLSLLLHATQANPTRIIGLAAALGDAEGLSDWLGVPAEGVYCFPPTERDQALSVTFQTFTIPYSAAFMKAMAKPVYDSIRTLPISESAIIFVPSVSQCNSVVAELVTQCALGMNLRGFLGEDVSQEMLEGQSSFLKNKDLLDGVMRGFGIWHDRMHQGDRILMLRLFVEGIIRVIVIPRELCWSAPVRAGLVIVMGTQYTVGGYSGQNNSIERSERMVVEYSLHELVRMQGRAVRHGKTGRLHILCQAEHRETYMRFLTDGLPLESQLLGQDDAEDVGSEVLKRWLKNQRLSGVIKSRQDVMDFFSSTFLTRRMEKNPSYYDVTGDTVVFLSRITDSLWDQTTSEQEEQAS
jgi:antiviral helicase SLH1